MDFSHSDEQLLLRDSARDWLAKRYPAERLAALADDGGGPGGDPAAWSQLLDLGWVEASAEGAVETAVLLEQAGYGLLPAPFFATVGLAGAFGADTSVPTTLASAEDGAPYLGDEVRTTVDPAGRVTGTKVLVPDLGTTTHAVVTTSAGARLVAISDARVVPYETSDTLRRFGDLVLDGVPSTALPDADPALVQAWVLTAAAAEAVGVAQRVLDLAAAYVSTREQFGRVIGTYQGVSHAIADVYVATELARSLTTWSAWAIDAGDPAGPLAAAAAKADAGAAAVQACETAIQVHGGIGFTWESVLHRYYKRAQWLNAFEGSGNRHRATVAAAILD